MISNELQRVYVEWRGRDAAQREKSYVSARLRAAMEEHEEQLEVRRSKLHELLEREKTGYLTAYCNKLQADEMARKEAIIAEAEEIKELIKTKKTEVAEREYRRLFNLSNNEYRLCRPTLVQGEIKKDQVAIDEFRKCQKEYEKSRDISLLQLGDGFSRKITDADNSRKVDKIAANKEHQKFLLQQIAENDDKKRLEEAEKLEEKKKFEEEMKAEADSRHEEELKRIEEKRKLRHIMENQIELVRNRLDKQAEESAAFEKAIRENWRPDSGPIVDRRERMRELNQKAKYFLQHQQQVREHRRCEELEAERQRAEIVEQHNKEEKEREQLQRCALMKLNMEAHESHKAAVAEKLKREIAVRTQKLEGRKGIILALQEEEENRRALGAAVEAKRKEFRMSLDKQMEEIRQRRRQEAECLAKEREAQRLANEAYQERMKNLVCDERMWIEFKLHPMRRMTAKRTA